MVSLVDINRGYVLGLGLAQSLRDVVCHF